MYRINDEMMSRHSLCLDLLLIHYLLPNNLHTNFPTYHQQQGPNQCAGDAFEEMTMAQIFNGKGRYFPGLLPLVHAYLDFINCDATTYKRVSEYLTFIEK